MINVPRVNAPQIDPNMALNIKGPTIDISPAMNAYFNARKMRNQEDQTIVENDRQAEQDRLMNPIREANARQANITSDQLAQDYEKSVYEDVLGETLNDIKTNGLNENTLTILDKKENKLKKILGKDYETQSNDFKKLKDDIINMKDNPLGSAMIMDFYGQQYDKIKSMQNNSGLTLGEDLFYLNGNKETPYSIAKDVNGNNIGYVDFKGNLLKTNQVESVLTEEQFNKNLDVENKKLKDVSEGDKQIRVLTEEEKIAGKKARSERISEIQAVNLERAEVNTEKSLKFSDIESIISSGEFEGGFGDYAKELISKLGIGDASSISAVYSNLNQLAMKELQLFKGPTTDFEFKKAQTTSGTQTDTAESIKAKLTGQKRTIWAESKRRDAFDEFIKDPKNNPNDFRFDIINGDAANKPFTYGNNKQIMKGSGKNSTPMTMNDIYIGAANNDMSIQDFIKELKTTSRIK